MANLLLARSLSRAKEVSIRSALGASRWRLVRQLLIESVLMGFMGGAIGLAISMWVSACSTWPRLMSANLTGSLTGVLFGLAPALHISRMDVNENLKEGGRGSSAGSRIKYLSGFMVVGEVALALVLLAGAA